MDLAAYANIESLDHILAENNISVPRLRGIRLMKNEKPYPKEYIELEINDIAMYECESACESDFDYNPLSYELSSRTKRAKKRYLVYKNDQPFAVRWDKVHGRKRKLFKYRIKQARKRTIKNLLIFNKYCGRDDVIYIHARIGGGNWPYYRNEVIHQKWFLEKVDDPFDSTYCDIYAKINA